MGKIFKKTNDGSWSYRQGVQDQEDELKKLLEIAGKKDLTPPKEKPGLLNRILGALRASETSGIAHDIQEGEGLGTALKNYGKRIGKGWTLQGLDEEDLGVPGYKEILERKGVSSEPWFEAGPLKPSTAGTLGLLGDIALDPLTYASFGTTAAGKQAGKTALKEGAQELAEKGAVRTIAKEGGEEAVERLGRTGAEQALRGQKSLVNLFGQPIVPKKVNAKVYQTSDDLIRKSAGTRPGRVAESVRQLFDTSAIPSKYKGIPELEDAWQKLTTAKQIAKSTERTFAELGKDKGKELYEMAVERAGGRKFFGQGAPKKIDDVQRIMKDTLDAYETGAKNVPEHIKPIVDNMKEYADFIEKQWTSVGGGALSDDAVNYWLRTLSKEERDKLLKSAGYNSREFSSKTASDVIREYVKVVDDAGVEHIGHVGELTKRFGNNIKDIKQATVKEINEALGFDKFSTNIAETGYLMGARTGRKTAGAEFFDLVRGLGADPADAPEGYVKLFGDDIDIGADLIKSTAKELRDSGLVFEPEIAKVIDNTYKSYFSDESISEVLKLYDDMLNVFKSSVTSLFPAFHARNAISNVWANYLGGVTNPKDYKEAAGIISDLKLGKELTGKQKQFWDEYISNGLSGFGYYGGDISKEIAPELSGKSPNILSKINRAGLEAGGTIEDVGKLTHYINKRGKGYSKLDAAQEVRKYLFDYADLTDFEKNIMKRIAPFYCVPEDSLALTNTGWKHYTNIKEGELLLTYNDDKDIYEWQPCLEIASFEHDQKLMVSENKRHKIRFTPEHRWVTERNASITVRPYGIYKYPESKSIKTGSELTTQDNIRVTATFNGKKSKYTVEDARLLGWLLTDGYFRSRGGYIEAMIYQSPKKFLEEVKEVAGGNPRKPHPDSGVVCVPVTKERVKPIKDLLRRNKSTDDWCDFVGSLSTEAMEAMYDAMYKADGTTVRHRHQDFFACSLDGVGKTFEMLATLLGKRVVKSTKGYYVSDQSRFKVGRTKLEHYTGTVWCPRTENGTWVMKQDKLITITGNTFTRMNIPMELEVLATKPSKFSNVVKATRGSTGDEEDLPEWLQEQGRLKVGEEDGLQRFLSGGLLDTPMTQPLDLIGEDVPSTLKKTAGSMLSPYLKLPMELAFDENMFFQEPISEVDNIPDVWGEDLYETALGDALGIVETGYGYKTSKPELWHILRSMGTRPFSTIESGAKISEEDKSILKQLLYLLTGTRVRDVDPQQSKYYKQKDVEEELKNFLEGQGAIYRGEYVGEAK